MASIFGANRGCVIRLKVDTSKGEGASLSKDQIFRDSCVIVGFNTKREESVSIVRCFKDNAFIYAFGDNLEQSFLGVKAITFIGGDAANNASFANVTDFYNKSRISVKPGEPLYFYYGGASTNIPCYLIGMESTTVSVDYGMHEIDFRLIMVAKKTPGSGGQGAIKDRSSELTA